VTPAFTYADGRLYATVAGDTRSADWVDIRRAGADGAIPGFEPFWWGVVQVGLQAVPAVDWSDPASLIAAIAGKSFLY
jgi:hypothetical protein